jgi:hypothetical protein
MSPHCADCQRPQHRRGFGRLTAIPRSVRVHHDAQSLQARVVEDALILRNFITASLI